MNVRAWICSLALLATGAIGCTKLMSGKCASSSDCKQSKHETCDPTTNSCVMTTDGGTGGTGGMGGAGAAAGSHGGAGGAKVTFACPNSLCKADGSTPICDVDAGTCRGCNNVESTTACRSLDAGTNACVSAADAGTSLGMCVVCVSNSDCTVTTKPICDPTSHNCVPCTSDVQCAGTGPSVCMLGDGHCATDAETVYVATSSSACIEPTSPPTADGGAAVGTSAHPLCTMTSVRSLVSAARDLVVLQGPVSGANWIYANDAQAPIVIVGQQNASIAPLGVVPAVFNMSSGTVTIRQVTFTQTTTIGIEATGGTLKLDHVTVSNCSGGGILIDGAAFDIENTTVTGNGPSTVLKTSTLGGIIVNNTTTVTPAQIASSTIANNKGPGLTCAGTITGTDLLVYGNASSQISCSGASTCADAGPMCGAQP